MRYEVKIYGKHEEVYAKYEIEAGNERQAIDKGIELYGNDDWDMAGAIRLKQGGE